MGAGGERGVEYHSRWRREKPSREEDAAPAGGGAAADVAGAAPAVLSFSSATAAGTAAAPLLVVAPKTTGSCVDVVVAVALHIGVTAAPLRAGQRERQLQDGVISGGGARPGPTEAAEGAGVGVTATAAAASAVVKAISACSGLSHPPP